jgi:glutamate 5-kinase
MRFPLSMVAECTAKVLFAGAVNRVKLMRSVRRIVVKIGTGVLTKSKGRIDRDVLDSIASQCAALANDKRDVVIVSSGAIALGVDQLGYEARPKKMDALQACAAAGQGHLIRMWQEGFAPHGRVVAQVLLTHADLAVRKRFLNARRALNELVARRAVPVINENDTVSVDEIAFGDNDALSAQVANLVNADLLVMMSVAPALLDGERRVEEVLPDDKTAEKFVRRDKSTGGTGGMVTKVRAARAASARGCAAVIAEGKRAGILQSVLEGENVGTLFWPQEERLASRAHWIAHTLRARGTLVIDAGAVTAVVEKRRSLLPSGIVSVKGTFKQGDPVDIESVEGTVIARGLATYSASEMEAIRGKKAAEISALLGYHLGDEAVHKDDLVVLED